MAAEPDSISTLPDRMRVVACTENGGTRIEERAVPSPGPGEILLRLRVCGLCGTDLFKLETASAPLGSVLGHEVVGEVVASGEGAGDWPLGERVVVPHHVSCGECAQCRRGSGTLCAVFRENLMEPGGFAEYVLIRERAVRLAARHVPAGVSDAAAVFLEPAACVLRGLNRSGLRRVPADVEPPGCAVVIGGGSMGLLHLLVLHASRPELAVVVIDPLEERRTLATGLGAAVACQPGGEALDAVRELSGSLGADAVFDTVGGCARLEDALALLREGGSVVLFAHAPEGDVAGFDLNRLFKNERRVLGTYSGGLEEQREVFDLIAARRLDASPLVTQTLPLEHFDKGVDLVRRHLGLKVLLVP